MANSEDVLDDIDVIALQNGVGPLERELIYRLAAVVRELRRDRARLDWLERHMEDDTPLLRWSDGSWSTSMYGPWSPCSATARDAIDAAMDGGEGEG